jgi:hypothetical protein
VNFLCLFRRHQGGTQLAILSIISFGTCVPSIMSRVRSIFMPSVDLSATQGSHGRLHYLGD